MHCQPLPCRRGAHRQQGQLRLLRCCPPKRQRLRLAVPLLILYLSCLLLLLLLQLLARQGGRKAAVLDCCIQLERLHHCPASRRSRGRRRRSGAAAVCQAECQRSLQVYCQQGAAVWGRVDVYCQLETAGMEHCHCVKQGRSLVGPTLLLPLQPQQRRGGKQREAAALCCQHHCQRRRQRRRQHQLPAQPSRGSRCLAAGPGVHPQPLQDGRRRGACCGRPRRQLPAHLPLCRRKGLLRKQQQHLAAATAPAGAAWCMAAAAAAANAVEHHRLQRQRQVSSVFRGVEAELKGGCQQGGGGILQAGHAGAAQARVLALGRSQACMQVHPW